MTSCCWYISRTISCACKWCAIYTYRFVLPIIWGLFCYPEGRYRAEGGGSCKSFEQVINSSHFFCSFSSHGMFSGKTLYQIQMFSCGTKGRGENWGYEVDPNSVVLEGVTEDKRTRKKKKILNKMVRINFALTDMTPC